MTKKLKLSEAAADILGGNVAAKRSGQDSFGLGKSLNPAAVQQGHGIELNAHAHDKTTEANPDYTKGVPSATAPGKTGLGKQDGVGASKATGPADSDGQAVVDAEQDADALATIADRKQGKKPTQTFQANPGAITTAEETESDEEQTLVEFDITEDVDALLAGENLSEEFKTKAAVIFEAAVNARVQSISEQMQEKLVQQFDEEVDSFKQELAERVDDYLNYVVEQFMEENKLAVEQGLKSELTESFINGMKNLFAEHYIDIPEEKVDLVSELADQVTTLEDQLNEQINKSVELNKELNEHKKMEAIHAVCEGLTQTQVEKVVSLAEGVDFTTQEEFVEKLEMIKESYFPSNVKVADKSEFLDEQAYTSAPEETTKYVDPEVAMIAKSITKFTK
jgi:hypothetical protein